MSEYSSDDDNEINLYLLLNDIKAMIAAEEEEEIKESKR